MFAEQFAKLGHAIPHGLGVHEQIRRDGVALPSMQQPGTQCFGKSFGGVGTQLIQRRERSAAEIVSGFAVGAEDEFDEMGVGVDRVGVAGKTEFTGLQDAVIRRVRLRPHAGRADDCPAISEFSQQSGSVGTVHVWDEEHDDGFG
jgi:hypothetical protein